MPSLTGPFASVVIPAFDEAHRLPGYLSQLVSTSARYEDRPVELLVVDDGSAPDHLAAHRACVAAAAAALAARGSRHAVRLVEAGANGGKGAAIRLGWAQGHPAAGWLGFLDADGAVPAAEVWRLLASLAEDAGDDVVMASRILMAGRTIRRSTYRHAQGRVFATIAERLFCLGCYDTQCGFKLVRASLLRPRLGLLRERGWLLDVELLAVVRAAGGRLREEPIDWLDPGGSKVRFGVDALRMLGGLFRVRRRLAASGILATSPALRG